MKTANMRPCFQRGGASISPLWLLVLLLCTLPVHAQETTSRFGTRPVDFDDVQHPTDQPAELVEPLEVQYPDSALRRGWEGVAVVAAWIDRRGDVVYGELRESSGHPPLDNIALNAVRRGYFKSARRDGLNVGSRVTIPVEFRLRRAEENYDAGKSEEQLQQEAGELRRAREMLEEERLRLEEELRLLKEQQKKKQEEKK